MNSDLQAESVSLNSHHLRLMCRQRDSICLPGEPSVSPEFLSSSDESFDLYSVLTGHSFTGTEKTAVYLGLFVQVTRDSLGTNSAAFGVVYASYISPLWDDLG